MLTTTVDGGIDWIIVLIAAAILILAWWGSSLIERLIHRATLTPQIGTQSRTMISGIARIARYILWLVLVLIGLSFVGVDLTGLAFLTGALVLGIGVGMQTVFSNYISGLILSLEQNVKLNDYVDLECGVRGVVREMTMRYTRIENDDAADVIVPNSEMLNRRLVNWSGGASLHRVHIPFSLKHDCSLAKLQDIAADLVERFPQNAAVPEIQVLGITEQCVQLELLIWLGEDNIAKRSRMESRYRLVLFDLLRKYELLTTNKLSPDKSQTESRMMS